LTSLASFPCFTEGMMTPETQIWTSAKATALDHVRDFLVAPVFD
jgi:hypothetical protein